ncbi:MAG TPA: hypothetical protein VGT05_01630 [Patescibacteria group bacterium]|nr:hypothetical protein [Patescibacteria group bacterium]
MATLTQVASSTRKILTISILLLIGFAVVLFLFNVAINVKNSLYPTPPTPPTVTYGKLPAILFPQSINVQKLSYTLNTLTGNLPSLPDRVAVNQIAQPQATLLDLQNTQNLVTQIGYVLSSQRQLNETLYQWTNTDDLPKTITMDTTTKDFTINSSYPTDLNVANAYNLPGKSGAITVSQTFLENFLGNLPSDIDNSKTTASFFTINNSGLVPATSFSGTKIVRVDFFQKNMNSLPIFYPYAGESLMNILIGGGSSLAQIVNAQFVHKTILSDNATYPIKTSQVAYQDLQNGNAYIASLDFGVTSVTIRNVLLGYYIGDFNEQYLMPIIVFEGDNNFVAYVSAITDGWISK